MAYNVLIVDDSETNRAVISKTLSLTGLPVQKVFHVGKCKEALDILNCNRVDIVFVDINLPGTGEDGMLDKLVKNDRTLRMLVVIVSTQGSKTRIEEFVAGGERKIFRRPITPEILAYLMTTMLGKGGEGKA